MQTAVSHRIPLIIWGAHQGLEQVGMFSHLHNVEMTRRYRKDHDLMGLEADDLLSTFDNLREEDIWQYRYPTWDEIDVIGVRGIYLGNYVRWDPLAQHHQMVKQFGYESAKQTRTFDTYDHVDDWHYADTHDWVKTLKYGYGKALDHASREIRYGRLTREKGEMLATLYQQQKPENKDLLLEWININNKALFFLLEGQANEDSFKKEIIKTRKVKPKDLKNSSLFSSNSNLARELGKKAIVIGKGYP